MLTLEKAGWGVYRKSPFSHLFYNSKIISKVKKKKKLPALSTMYSLYLSPNLLILLSRIISTSHYCPPKHTYPRTHTHTWTRTRTHKLHTASLHREYGLRLLHSSANRAPAVTHPKPSVGIVRVNYGTAVFTHPPTHPSFLATRMQQCYLWLIHCKRLPYPSPSPPPVSLYHLHPPTPVGV